MVVIIWVGSKCVLLFLTVHLSFYWFLIWSSLAVQILVFLLMVFINLVVSASICPSLPSGPVISRHGLCWRSAESAGEWDNCEAEINHHPGKAYNILHIYHTSYILQSLYFHLILNYLLSCFSLSFPFPYNPSSFCKIFGCTTSAFLPSLLLLIILTITSLTLSPSYSFTQYSTNTHSVTHT